MVLVAGGLASGKSVIVRRLGAVAPKDVVADHDFLRLAEAAAKIVPPPRIRSFVEDDAADDVHLLMQYLDSPAGQPGSSPALRDWLASPWGRSQDAMYALWRDPAVRYIWSRRNRAGELQLDNDLEYYAYYGTGGKEAALRCYHRGHVTAMTREFTLVETDCFLPLDPDRIVFVVNAVEYDWVLPGGEPRPAASKALFRDIVAQAQGGVPVCVVFTHMDELPAKLLNVAFRMRGLRNVDYRGPLMQRDAGPLIDAYLDPLKICTAAVKEYLKTQYPGADRYVFVDAIADDLSGVL